MVDIVLRQATGDDRPFLQQMLYEAANRPGDDWPPLEESINEPRNRRFWLGWPRPGDLGVIAQDPHRPIGAAWIRTFTDEERSPIDHPDAATLAIGIERDFRGQGVGGRLMADLIRRARASGVHAIELTTGLFNQPAIRLYERRGFIETMPAGAGIQMRLDLDPPDH